METPADQRPWGFYDKGGFSTNDPKDWTDEEVDAYLDNIKNTQLLHRINAHELLVIATTPEQHKEAAIGVARDKVRQTFRKAVLKHRETHSYNILYTKDDEEIRATMWRILDNRNRRLKARWNKVKASKTTKVPGPRDKGYCQKVRQQPSEWAR